MFNIDVITNENNAEHNSKYIPDHPYIITTKGGLESRKSDALLNLIRDKRARYGCTY